MLNDSLYLRLKKIFKEVKVSNPGVPFIYKNGYDVLTGKRTVEIIQRGETYCVCCPYCKHRGAARHDSRFRLWVNHRWGTYMDGFNTYSLATCFNENCLSDGAIKEAFITLVESARIPLTIEQEIKTYSSNEFSYRPVELPSGSVSVSSLEPGHPARIFLESRKFDPDYISGTYGVRYIEFSFERPTLNNSLLIPIYQDNRLVAWQCRKLDNETGKSKYITSTGAQISKFLYNWDNSAGYDYAIIVEGVFDVWRIGAPALGVFGAHISNAQFEKLKSRYSIIFVMFDGDARDKAMNVCKRFASSMKMIPVLLDRDKDPADYTSAELKSFLARALEKSDVGYQNTEGFRR